jgi:hypothetical protein
VKKTGLFWRSEFGLREERNAEPAFRGSRDAGGIPGLQKHHRLHRPQRSYHLQTIEQIYIWHDKQANSNRRPPIYSAMSRCHAEACVTERKSSGEINLIHFGSDLPPHPSLHDCRTEVRSYLALIGMCQNDKCVDCLAARPTAFHFMAQDFGGVIEPQQDSLLTFPCRHVSG